MAFGVTVCAIVLGVAAGTAFAAGDHDNISGYSVNSQGQTFGTNQGADRPETWPDLVAVMNSSGVTGYVSAKDLAEAQGWWVSNPEEAARWMEIRATRDAPTLIMYDENGDVIGSWDGMDWSQRGLERRVVEVGIVGCVHARA